MSNNLTWVAGKLERNTRREDVRDPVKMVVSYSYAVPDRENRYLDPETMQKLEENDGVSERRALV